jgi:hypothetical protein
MRSLHPLTFRSLLQHLKDPQLQVWLMSGLALVLLIIGHIRAWSPVGEGKIGPAPTASRLLLAGASVSWNDEFAPGQRPSRRPVLILHNTVATQQVNVNPAPGLFEVRSLMEQAAGRPWRYLSRPLRQQLARAPSPNGPLRATLRWSGDHRGNAPLIALQDSHRHPNAKTSFVIGNGSRSKDGEIEMLFPRVAFAGGQVEIILIGSGTNPTPRQTSALGELLNHLEAMSGHLLMADTPALTPVAA